MNPTPPHPNRLKILWLEDDAADAKLFEGVLRKELPEARIDRVDSREGFLAALTEEEFDLVLSDYTIPGFSGLEALDLVRSHRPQLPYVFFSGTIGEDRAVEALKKGATDFVIKDRPGRLVAAVRRALEEARIGRSPRTFDEMERLARDVVHRINNALTGLSLGIPLIRDRVKDPEVLHLLAVVESGFRACAELVCRLEKTAREGGAVSIEGLLAPSERPAPAGNPEWAERSRSAAAFQENDRRPAILIIDDEPVVRMLSKALLEASGYRAILADNGADGIATYRALHREISAVLTDTSMPVMNGTDVIRALRAFDPEVGIVVMSGLGDPSNMVAEPGKLVFLHKPMTRSKLLEAIGQVLRVS